MIQDTGNRLFTAFQKQTEKIIYYCSSENIPANLSVHEIRKSFKRIRALLHFYSESHAEDAAKWTAEIKAAGKVLSPIRELHVNLQLFERIAGGDSHFSERKIKQVRDVLTEKNRLLLEKELIGNETLENILRFTKEFESFTEWIGNHNPSLRQMENQLAESYAQSSGIWLGNEFGFAAETMHELRKSLKILLYQIEFLKYMHPRYFRLKSDQLTRVTEQLGEDHDLFVFIYELKMPEYSFGYDEIIVLENQVSHLQEINRIKLQPRLKQVFSETPEMFEHKLGKIFRINL